MRWNVVLRRESALGCPGEADAIARAGILTAENGSCAFEPPEIRRDMAETRSPMRRFNDPGREEIERAFFGIRRRPPKAPYA